MGSGPYSNRAGRPFAARTAAVATAVAAVFVLYSLAVSAPVEGSGQPVVVTAKTLLADNKKKVVVYKKDVVVRQGKMTLYADEVTVRLGGPKSEGPASASGPEALLSGSGSVESIEASGGVKVVVDDKTATSDVAVYNAAKDSIVMTGKPRVWQGQNVLTGSKITFRIKDDTIEVEDANTVLYPDEGREAPARP